MDGSNGRGSNAPRLCAGCNKLRQHEEARWSRESVIAAIQDWVVEYGQPPSSIDWNPALAETRGAFDRARRFREAEGKWPWTEQVQRVFGSWNAAIEAAGFEPLPPGHGRRRAVSVA